MVRPDIYTKAIGCAFFVAAANFTGVVAVVGIVAAPITLWAGKQVLKFGEKHKENPGDLKPWQEKAVKVAGYGLLAFGALVGGAAVVLSAAGVEAMVLLGGVILGVTSDALVMVAGLVAGLAVGALGSYLLIKGVEEKFQDVRAEGMQPRGA